MKKRLLIAGGTGLIGSAIKEEAQRLGWEVVVLSRKPLPGAMLWNPAVGEISMTAPEVFDAILNLAGTSIAGGRWTDQRKKEIQDSRVKASGTIEKYLLNGLLVTQVYIGSSAIGIYGDQGAKAVDEKSPLGSDTDWMVRTGIAWEEGHARIAALGIRTVVLRIGIVMTPKGGALREMLLTAPLGVIGYFGHGRQFWPWIHMKDLTSIIFRAITMDSMSGIYMAVAPQPVTNKEISKAAAKALRPGRIVVPVPEFFLAILLGQMRMMLLQSCRGYPARLLAEGFSFNYPYIKEAMQDLLAREKGKAA
jgi:uncharacterized protein (TIGR01777 family)